MRFLGWFRRRQPSGLSRRQLIEGILEHFNSFEGLLLKSHFHTLLDAILKTRNYAKELEHMEANKSKKIECAYIVSRLNKMVKLVELIEYYSSKSINDAVKRDEEMNKFRTASYEIRKSLVRLHV